ncbi:MULTISPECIES: glycosyltransferase family 4 protein [unclassified Cyanobium]|uniref:MraY family glycosyltransferase n=1 Tax=unclassified Cyanobium TaxID=2627006 RepID=UPI0020CEE024|nr:MULTISPECIES: glycosyltransferase family 4 protein [unclassified Cyanobium]MCP9857654.1 glycosyltransferase family 4 protein [Cyanobium sp. Cruz-8H5]MCP9864773.1 glycosyltransferase family 4 protein [Cyanobium sp. Cruz-8D1]
MTALHTPAVLLLGSGLGALLLHLLLPLLRRALVDQPNARSSHQRPTPRGGGLAFVLVGSALAPLAGGGWPAWIPLLCLPLALVGLLDDRLDLPAAGRYGIQITTALALVAITPLTVAWWLLPVAWFAVTAVINFVNFSDGLDGLVAGCASVLLGVAVLAMAPTGGNGLLPLIGALLSFLVWNWSPARVFMGDVGSTFLGAVIAGMVLQQATPAMALGLLLAGFPLLGDPCLCVLRRWQAGQPIFQAHRLHLYQRLHQAGWPHDRVALLYIGATALLGWALLVHGLALELGLLSAELVVALWLDRHRAVPFSP